MFKINAVQLLNIISTLNAGCGNDNLNLLTQSINIRTKGDKIQFITTDTRNYTYAMIEKPNGVEDFDIFVDCNLFTRFVNKCDYEEISFEIKDFLEVTGKGGIYKIPILEKTAEFVIPNHELKLQEAKKVDLSKATIDTIQSFNAPFLSKVTSSIGANYYVKGDKVYSTNNTIICEHKLNQTFEDVMLNQRLVKILSTIKDDIITWYNHTDYNYFESSNVVVYNSNANAGKYPIEAVLGNLIQDKTKNVAVPFITLKGIMEKINLFINPIQNNAVKFIIDEDVKIQSFDDNATDVITSANTSDKFNFTVDGMELGMVLANIKDSDIDSGYITIISNDNVINIYTKESVYVVGTLSED